MGESDAEREDLLAADGVKAGSEVPDEAGWFAELAPRPDPSGAPAEDWAASQTAQHPSGFAPVADASNPANTDIGYGLADTAGPLPVQPVVAAADPRPLAAEPEKSRLSGMFLFLLLLGGIAVGVGIGVGAWLLAGSEQAETATGPAVSAVGEAVDPDGVSGSDAEAVAGAPDAEAGSGDDSLAPVDDDAAVTDEAASGDTEETEAPVDVGEELPPGVDPLTGQPYPESLQGLSQAELAMYDYPRGLLTPTGEIILRGRVITQERLDETLAIIAAAGVTAIDEMTVTPGFPDYRGLNVFLQDFVVFDFNSVELDPAFLPLLDATAQAFAVFPGLRVTVIGYADAVGLDSINQRVSELRAQAVVDYWVSQGVDPSRAPAIGRGAITGEGESQQDRRVEFLIELLPSVDG